ncbi:MAG: hypothetical protein NTX53_08195 [candidate division WOR-3 bacterium]|nr:hypothetical protein [candidate division WOR-3 bacterium]
MMNRGLNSQLATRNPQLVTRNSQLDRRSSRFALAPPGSFGVLP